MTEEKETAKKEAQKEIDPHLKELIEVMKAIKKEMPDFEKEERITVFLEYRREKGNHFETEKLNMNSANPVNIESLLNTLSFKTSKNGKSEFAKIEKDLGAKLPQHFIVGEYDYFNKGDALIRIKKNEKQKKQ